MINDKFLRFQIKRKVFQFRNGDKKENVTLFGKPILGIDESNILIHDMLLDGSPRFIGRIGSTEMGVINDYFNATHHLRKKISDKHVECLCKFSGFFPPDEKLVESFSKLYLDCGKQLDVFALFQHGDEDFYAKQYASQSKLVELRSLEPYYSQTPYTSALEGKRVLVVHPFAKTIESQYKKRELLFRDQRILPAFSLRTIASVQSLGGNGDSDAKFKNWFDALHFMEEQISLVDFDVALLGCGAYSLPLASFIKENLKKNCVIVGGSLQILFGIKGARWDCRPFFQSLYNENWVRPS